jgi:hypothetical protein
VSGNGNSYDYGFRIYNPRLGRFLSVDPLTVSYPALTPYQFAANMPIVAIDVDGLEALIQINSVKVSEKFQKIKNTEGIDAAIKYALGYVNKKHTKKGIGWLRKSSKNNNLSDDVVILVDDAGLPADVTVISMKYDETFEAQYEINEYTLSVPEEIPVEEASESWWPEVLTAEYWMGDTEYNPTENVKVKPSRFSRWKEKNVDPEMVKDLGDGRFGGGGVISETTEFDESIPADADPTKEQSKESVNQEGRQEKNKGKTYIQDSETNSLEIKNNGTNQDSFLYIHSDGDTSKQDITR